MLIARAVSSCSSALIDESLQPLCRQNAELQTSNAQLQMHQVGSEHFQDRKMCRTHRSTFLTDGKPDRLPSVVERLTGSMKGRSPGQIRN